MCQAGFDPLSAPSVAGGSLILILSKGLEAIPGEDYADYAGGSHRQAHVAVYCTTNMEPHTVCLEDDISFVNQCLGLARDTIGNIIRNRKNQSKFTILRWRGPSQYPNQ